MLGAQLRDRGRRVQAYWEQPLTACCDLCPATAGKLCELHAPPPVPQGPPAAPSFRHPGLGVSRTGVRAIGGRLQGGRETGFEPTVGYQLGHHGREEYREGAETEWVWAGAAGERAEGGR